MTQNNNLASFWCRAIAILLDGSILILPTTFYLSVISSSINLASFIAGLVILLTLVLFPTLILHPLIYSGWVNSKFGGTLGKLISGLRVYDLTGNKYLNYKRSFFRYTIGYSFSSLFLGLGFWSVLKDPKRQAWHDKAIGSIVVTKSNLWPVGLVLLLIGVGLNFYFLTASINKISTGPIASDISALSTELIKQQQMKDKNPQLKLLEDQLKYATTSSEIMQMLEEATASGELQQYDN